MEGADLVPIFSSRLVPALHPVTHASNIKLSAKPEGRNPALVQSTKEIPITNATNSIDTKMDYILKTFQASTFRMCKANEPGCGVSQTARAYTIQADCPARQAQMIIIPPNSPMGSNLHQHWQQEIGPCIHFDEQGHICTFYPDICSNQEQGIFYLYQYGRWTLGPREGNGEGISVYWLERRNLSMCKHTSAIALQWLQGGGVAIPQPPQLPQPQHITRSQLFQGASSPWNLYA